MNEFKKLGIIEPLLKVIEEEHFKEPTEIQAKSIPVVIEGKDVLAGSATGSGKTLAFASGILQSIEKRKGIQAIILTPTRELAEQVGNSFKKFAKYVPVKTVIVYGGVSIGPQIEKIKSADIVVGTPGRVLDHLSRNTLRLDKVKTLVLDEADRMLDMGFRDDVEKIMKQCPKFKQTLLFSATITRELSELSKKYMKNPVKVSAESYVDAKKLKQIYYDVQDNMKFSMLVHLLKHEQAGLAMVFCNTRKNVDFVADNLKSSGVDALAIHGGFTQDKRSKIMKQFDSQKRLYVLVCTDVAARGLDIQGVSHVYNYDIPKDPKEYIHRIGRTARAGSEGKAINILVNRDYNNFRKVMRENDVDVEKEKTPFVERVKIKPAKPSNDFRKKKSGGFGGGKSKYGGGKRNYHR
ncbi:MAG: DEAD/DEAH box helicase [Candidatus Aenigmarchaeota archaeon]|nr:DEAD/DEAH box helicase [Candidatus Aenigmarchaeota archaeon]